MKLQRGDRWYIGISVVGALVILSVILFGSMLQQERAQELTARTEAQQQTARELAAGFEDQLRVDSGGPQPGTLSYAIEHPGATSYLNVIGYSEADGFPFRRLSVVADEAGGLTASRELPTGQIIPLGPVEIPGAIAAFVRGELDGTRATQQSTGAIRGCPPGPSVGCDNLTPADSAKESKSPEEPQ